MPRGKRSDPRKLMQEKLKIVRDLETRAGVPKDLRMTPIQIPRQPSISERVVKGLVESVEARRKRRRPPGSDIGARVVGENALRTES